MQLTKPFHEKLPQPHSSWKRKTTGAGFADEKGVGSKPDEDLLTDEVRRYREQLNARLWLWAPSITLNLIAACMDETIQVSSIALIGAEFNSLNSISWLGTAYFVGVITGYMLWCSVCDIVGRKLPIVLYHASSLVGLFLASFSNSMVMLSTPVALCYSMLLTVTHSQ
jgi:hypothetical protein